MQLPNCHLYYNLTMWRAQLDLNKERLVTKIRRRRTFAGRSRMAAVAAWELNGCDPCSRAAAREFFFCGGEPWQRLMSITT